MQGIKRSTFALMALLLFVGGALSTSVSAEAFFKDDFRYADGVALSGQGPWTGSATIDEASVLASGNEGDDGTNSLHFADLPNLTGGGRAQMNEGSGALTYIFPTPITGEGNSAYVSFLYKPEEIGGTTYMLYFRTANNPAGTSQIGRLDTASASDPNANFAVRIRNSGSRQLVPGDGYPIGETVLVVVRASMVPGADNDTMSIWVNPTPGAAEPAPDAMAVGADDPGHDYVPEIGLLGVSFRISGSTAVYEMDGFRAGTSWEDVTGDPPVDTQAPQVTTQRPAPDSTVLGSITHVAVGFDEGVTGVDAADLTVNGQPATVITGENSGPYYFSGFPALETGTSATVELAAGGIADANANAYEGTSWTVTVGENGLLFTDQFIYPNFAALTDQPDWGGDANVDEAIIYQGDTWGDGGSDSLQYAGLSNLSVGGRLAVAVRSGTSNHNAYFELDNPVVGEGNALYASFLFRPGADTATGGGTYFFHFRTPGSVQSQLGRVMGNETNAPNHTFAVRLRSSTSNADVPGAGLVPGVTAFIVVKVSMVPGANNDTMQIWVNPTPDAAEPTATATSVPDIPENEIDPTTGILGINLRIRDTTGVYEMDGLRVSTNWEEATKNPILEAIAPIVETERPTSNTLVYGQLTHARVTFDEPVMGVTAGSLTVDGSAATEVTGFGAGPYIFTGFNVVSTPGTVTLNLGAAGIADVYGNAFSGYEWKVPMDQPENDLIFYDGFDYPDGTSLSVSGTWIGDAVLRDAAILNAEGATSGSLTYAGLSSSRGGRVVVNQLSGSTHQAEQDFSGAVIGEGSSVYISFLVKPTGLVGRSYFGFLHAPGTDSTQTPRLNASNANTPDHTFQARWRDGGTAVSEPGTHPLGETVLLVYKATMNPGPDNDTFDLWVNPTVGGVEPAPDVTATPTDGSGNDIIPSRGWDDFRWRIASNTGDYDLDELRIGTSWAAVTPAPTPPVAPTALDLDAADDTGLANDDNITTLTTGLTISGVAELGTTVEINEGATLLASGTADDLAAGIDIDLVEGSHDITATATSGDGASPASAALTIIVDATAPTVALSSTAPDPTESDVIPATATFSEAPLGFTEADIVVGNATLSDFTEVDPLTFTFNLTALAPGAVTADIPAGSATDTAGNSNLAADQLSRTYTPAGPTHTLAVIVVGDGTVATMPDQTVFEEGATVVLTATPNAGSMFVGWSGDVTSTDLEITVTMDANKAITATFAPITHTLAVTINGDGSVTQVPADQTVFNDGDTVELTAVPGVDQEFKGWTGDVDSLELTINVTMDADKNIVANFAPVGQNALSVTIEGQGAVAKNPDGNAFNPGTVVELTATAEAGWEFAGWSGDLTGTDNPTSVTMDADKNITATFTEITFTLTLETPTNGAITANPDQTTFPSGDTVDLTATPDVGYKFTGWTGDADGTDNPLTVIMDVDKTIGANFVEEGTTVTRTLTIETAGTGTGSVTKNPDQTEFTDGATVELTAAAADGSVFAGWSGDVAASTEATITVTMDADKTITATFDKIIPSITTYTLTLTAGDGGAVTPDGVTTYDAGTTVSIEATPADADTVFAGWTGDVPEGDEMTNPLVITIDADKTIAATFKVLPAPADYKITWKKSTLVKTEVGEGQVSLALSGGTVKSSIKIQRLKKLPKKMTEKDGTTYILGLRLIPELSVTGAFGKITCDAEVEALTSDGAIKSITTKIANIALIDAASVATIKMTALRNDAAEVATTAIVTGAGADMKLTLNGVVLDSLATSQNCKYIKLASKAWKDKATKVKYVSLGGATGDITAAGAKSIAAKGASIACDLIRVGQDITNLKAQSKKLNKIDYAATLGKPVGETLMQVLAPNIKTIFGTAAVNGVFIAGFDTGTNAATYTGAIKSIGTKAGAPTGEAHISATAKAIKFKPSQGDFQVLTSAPTAE